MGKDKRLRQAFSLAIDREAAMQVVFDGTALAGNQPFSPNSPWYDKDIPVPARDVEKAKALIKAAGYDRVPVEIAVTNDPVTMQTMQIIQSMVAEAGFDVTLKPTEFATLLDAQTGGNYQFSRSDWSGRPDPDGVIQQFVTTGAGLNDSKYSNPQIDKLLLEARQSQDNAVRKQKYDAAEAIMNDELPIIYLGHQAWIWAYNKSVTGFVPSPDGMIRLVGVKKSS
jgi:peptide/nickel transport system substrate-binding protein